MERADILQLARDRAELELSLDQDPTAAISAFVTVCQREKLDPPLHHATITQGVLLAHDGNRDAVRQWMGAQQ